MPVRPIPRRRFSDKDIETAIRVARGEVNEFSGDPDQARLNREWEARQKRMQEGQSTDSSQGDDG